MHNPLRHELDVDFTIDQVDTILRHLGYPLRVNDTNTQLIEWITRKLRVSSCIESHNLGHSMYVLILYNALCYP